VTGRLNGKTAFVTAAGQGIGRASALAFLREGARVIATDRSTEHFGDIAHDPDLAPNLTVDSLDVTDDAAVQAAAEKHGAVDVLFNCAGWVHHGAILDTPPADWDASFALNVRAMYMTARAFLPAMLEAGGGSIINMASIAGSEMGVANRCAYGASKAAVIGLTKSIAADYITRGIRCNALCPGTVDTPSLQERINALPDPDQARKDFVARQPMGRLARADEIAELAVYLATDESAFVTGQAMIIDGGMHL
jgi:NAD(P)-dependent dehydrogenase (short-subunit alcohol dehydrogenase family)